MRLRPRVQGDIGDTITVTVGGLANLDNVTTAVAHVRLGPDANTLPVAIVDAAARTVAVTVDPWLADAPTGTWSFELELTFANGDTLTAPADRPDQLPVRAGLDPAAP